MPVTLGVGQTKAFGRDLNIECDHNIEESSGSRTEKFPT